MQTNHSILDELINRNFITLEDANKSLKRAEEEGRSALRILVDDKYVTEAAVYEVVADAAGTPFIDPEEIAVDEQCSRLLTGEWARRLNALPYAWDGDQVRIAVTDPTDLNVADDLRRLTKHEIILVLAPPASLTQKISQIYRAEEELGDLASGMETEVQEEAQGDEGNEAPIIRYVNLLIAQAVADRASDIHLEPAESELIVRFRIDGVLQPQSSTQKGIASSVISRVKIMAAMDIAERRVPQDGRMTININGRKVDLRVASLPTVYGEKIIMRILDNSSGPVELSDMGLSEYHQEIYKKHYKKPYGMILVTGPTGSGKSTTLYATLNAVKSPTVNIITVEDPVEFRMPGINQVQINNKAGLTFAAALRSILRADPDIILVGEVRDRETAAISVEASLTGHLVLTTLHTNDAASAITRLVEMGVEPYLLGSALNLVVAQRLLRRLCERCSEEYTLDEERVKALDFPWVEGTPLPVVRKPVGCTVCAKTGYKGRTAIHEMLEVTPEIERLANDGGHTDQIRALAIEKDGMQPMRTDGWQKVLLGETTIEEVLRVSA